MAESIETTGETLEDAKTNALLRLGVTEREAEIEVLEHPVKGGLFKPKRPARVRARARLRPDEEGAMANQSEAEGPTEEAGDGDEVGGGVEDAGADGAAPVEEGVSGEGSSRLAASEEAGDGEEGEDGDVGGELTPEERMELLDREADIAADFLEGLLDLLGLPGDIEIVVREEQALVNVTDLGSGLLIGRRGATLDALQELVRCAVQRQTERRSHVRVDVENYRERQLEKLRDKCREAIAEVRETKEPVQLEPMDPYERKVMHDVVAKASGVTSTSEGNEPRRRVVIQPAAD